MTTRREADRQRAALPHRRALNTQRYRRFRLAFLTAQPICADCKRAAAAEVHHIRKLADHLEDLMDPENCLGLCKACHDIRSARGE